MRLPAGLRGGPIYLDYNATTPIDPRVTEACLPYLGEHFGNPSSGHAYGRAAHGAVTSARGRVAELVDGDPSEIVFTGGGSDGDTLAIRGAALAGRERGDHIITQVTEHPAVLAVCDSLARLHGFQITQLPVDEHGRVDPAELKAALRPGTVLVSIMHANNETGTLQPIRELAAIAHARGALFHTDASQSVAKIGVSVRDLGVDLLTLTGHKMYAPKGIGALHVREGVNLEPAVYGGRQEDGRRGGTENVALIAALGRAAELALDTTSADGERLERLRDQLQQRLRSQLGGRAQLNGHPTERLPNTLNISIDGVPAEALLAATPGIAASTGSACHEGDSEPSPVLAAMRLPPERARSALRLTLGRWTTGDDITAAATLIAETATGLLPPARALSATPSDPSQRRATTAAY